VEALLERSRRETAASFCKVVRGNQLLEMTAAASLQCYSDSGVACVV